MASALVTGASAGIGKAIAEALSRRGRDVVLVARDKSRLEALAASLPTGAEVLAADLTDSDQLAVVERRLADRGRPIDLLVNNAGFGTTGRFVEMPVDEEEREIRLNVLALTRLTHAALPGMIARQTGGILNVASLAGLAPVPQSATYGGTKAFVTNFSLALAEEMRGTGVRVTVVCPGFTRTEFQERAGYDASKIPGIMWQSAAQVAETALRAVERGDKLCVPGALNKVGAGALHLVPRAIAARLAGAFGAPT